MSPEPGEQVPRAEDGSAPFGRPHLVILAGITLFAGLLRFHELGEWALIPALGERRMSVGFPIFLLDVRKYRARERRWVRPIFNSGDAGEAHRRAHELGIDYLVVGAPELRVRGERVRPLFEAEDRFRVVFESGDVAVLEVLAP